MAAFSTLYISILAYFIQLNYSFANESPTELASFEALPNQHGAVLLHSSVNLICNITTALLHGHNVSILKIGSDQRLPTSHTNIENSTVVSYYFSNVTSEDTDKYICVRDDDWNTNILAATHLIVGLPPIAPPTSCVLSAGQRLTCCMSHGFDEVKQGTLLGESYPLDAHLNVTIGDSSSALSTCGQQYLASIESSRCCDMTWPVSENYTAAVRVSVTVGNDLGNDSFNVKLLAEDLLKPYPPRLSLHPSVRYVNISIEPHSAELHKSFHFLVIISCVLSNDSRERIFRQTLNQSGMVLTLSSVAPHTLVQCQAKIRYLSRHDSSAGQLDWLEIGSWSEWTNRTCLTLEDVPTASPTFLPAIYLSNNSKSFAEQVTIFFEHPPVNSRNGIITHFIFECIWSENDKQKDKVSGKLNEVTCPMRYSQTSHSLTYVQIWTCNSVGCSATASNFTMPSTGNLPQLQPKNIFHLLQKSTGSTEFQVISVLNFTEMSTMKRFLLLHCEIPPLGSANLCASIRLSEHFPTSSNESEWFVNVTQARAFQFVLFPLSNSSSIVAFSHWTSCFYHGHYQMNSLPSISTFPVTYNIQHNRESNVIDIRFHILDCHYTHLFINKVFVDVFLREEDDHLQLLETVSTSLFNAHYEDENNVLLPISHLDAMKHYTLRLKFTQFAAPPDVFVASFTEHISTGIRISVLISIIVACVIVLSLSTVGLLYLCRYKKIYLYLLHIPVDRKDESKQLHSTEVGLLHECERKTSSEMDSVSRNESPQDVHYEIQTLQQSEGEYSRMSQQSEVEYSRPNTGNTYPGKRDLSDYTSVADV